MPLIEQPYLLKMVIVTERIGTALVRSENVLQSQRDILMQLVTGDYPDLQMLHQRALHQQLDFTRPLRLAALRLEVVPPVSPVPARAGRSTAAAGPPQRASAAAAAQPAGQFLSAAGAQQHVPFLLPDEEEGFQQKNGYSSGCRRWLTERVCRCSAASAPVRQLQGYPRALSQARQALDLCDTLRPTQRISDYQQLGFIKLLSAVSDPALLNDFMHDTSAA